VVLGWFIRECLEAILGGVYLGLTEKLPAHTDNTNTIVHVSLSEHHAVIGRTRDGMTRKKSLSLHTDDELVKQFEQSRFSYEPLMEEMNKRGIIIDPMGGLELQEFFTKKARRKMVEK
jgi:hypothetical protein